MKKIFYFVLFILLFPIFSIAKNNPIHEEKFISIGGIEQWITIKGEDKTKPIILFLHGGPGSTMSHYQDTIYRNWENDFVLVNWDQRGAGKTYGRNTPSEIDEDYYIKNPLTVEQMTRDGIELTKYLLDYLVKQKVILVGTSWGSILGVQMALKSPELSHAYVGHAQFVNFSQNIEYTYKKVYELAKNQKDEIALEMLNLLGHPPYDTAKNYGQLLKVVKKYESENSNPAPDFWWKIAPEYDNENDTNDRFNGDDYSFINFVGHKKLGIKSMALGIDFNKDGLVFKIPVYFIQGEHDILTSKDINNPYFNKIEAPKKEYYLLPNAAHGHNQSVVEKQFQIVKMCASSE